MLILSPLLLLLRMLLLLLLLLLLRRLRRRLLLMLCWWLETGMVELMAVVGLVVRLNGAVGGVRERLGTRPAVGQAEVVEL